MTVQRQTDPSMGSRPVNKTESFGLWIARSYIHIFNLVVFLYLALSFAAPVAMKTGHPLAARAIYTIYSPLCHQLPFRSLFLYGQQPYYPREEAGLSYPLHYEDITGSDPVNLFTARGFLGTEELGYKVAICERDIALYGAILLFGLLFASSGRRLPKIKWTIWVLFGILPIAWDGFSQIPGLVFPHLANQFIRESTPMLRYLTGGLFGFFSAWFLYPRIEESMRDNISFMTSEKKSSPKGANGL